MNQTDRRISLRQREPALESDERAHGTYKSVAASNLVRLSDR